MARALAAAIAVSLLAVSGAGGAGAQTPRKGGAVVFASNEPPCLNFLIPACSSVQNVTVRTLVLKGAFKWAPDFTLRVDLVSDVDFTTKRPFTLTYHIRPEAHWSDGVQISAKDFIFTHQAIRKYSPQGTADPHRTRVRGVRALDAKTVRVVLRGRFAGWRSGLFREILPQHALVGEDLKSIWKNRIDNPKTGEPIGSGPFLVGRWEREKQLTAVRNARYWGPHAAYLERLVFRFDWVRGIPAEVLRKGDIDITWSPVVRQEDHRRIPGYRTIFAPLPTFEHIAIRVGEGGHRALKSKLVRRALAYSIDRVSVVRSLFGEIDPKLRPLDSTVFLTQSRFYTPNWNMYRHRPGEARRLLEQAGCRRGTDGIYACGGEKLSLGILTTAGSPRRELIVRLVQQQLRRVGIEVKPNYAPSGALFGQILENGDYDLSLFADVSAPDGSGAGGALRCGGPLNSTGYCQRLVTRDLDQADRILDQDRRARVLNRADAQMARDVPIIPLFQPLIAGYVKSNIRNYVDRFPLDRWKVENWWLAERR